MAQVHQIVSPVNGISCHAWNKTGDMLALCPNNNELHIYEGCDSQDISSWRRTHVLAEHDMVISGISWSAANDKIVTCSHDRNAYVWKYSPSDSKWMPTLCSLRIDRAAISVEWSPDGSKFAVASSSKSVPVCFHDNSQFTDWYVSKMIKKHKSTVLQVAWHPNSQLLATVCSDRKCRVLSATMQEVDPVPDSGPFPAPVPFGEVYPAAEFVCNGWTTAVAWSAGGTQLSFSGQDSSVTVVDFSSLRSGSGAAVVRTVKYALLPLVSLAFIGESGIVGAGYDMEPLLFTKDSKQGWQFTSKLEGSSSKASSATSSATSSMSAARAMFQARTSRAEQVSTSAAGIKSLHANPISCMRARPSSNSGSSNKAADMQRFSTTGTDGRIVLWELSSLNLDMGALGL